MPQDLIWRLRVEQYHAMIRAGILTTDDPVELLEGWLVYKMPHTLLNCVATRLARTALERLLPIGWYVDTQAPITLEDSEPEPDVAIIRCEPRLYTNRHPGPADLALVVEVADATLLRDRGAKKRIYAHAGIAVYWIINLSERLCEVYTDPSAVGGEPGSPTASRLRPDRGYSTYHRRSRSRFHRCVRMCCLKGYGSFVNRSRLFG